MDQNDIPQMPPEYQAQLQQIMRQRQMAQMLMQQNMAPQNTEVISGHAVRQSPMSQIARALAGLTNAYGVSKSDENAANVARGMSQAQAEEGKRLFGVFQQNPAQGVAEAASSKFPQYQKLAQEWQKSLDARLKGAGEAMATGGDIKGAVGTFGSGQIPTDYQGKTYPEPVVSQVDGPNGKIPMVTTTDKFGVKDAKLGSPGVNVTTKIGTREGEMALDALKEDKKARQERAQIAKESLQSNQTALQAIAEGAQSGGGEALKQSIRKAAQAFGVNAPETASTEQLQMGLGDAILKKARALAPVTGEDVVRLEKILGSVNTDPTALSKMMAIYNGLAVKELQTYNNWVNTQAQNLETPYARDLFKGAGIGYEVQAPPGNQTQQLQAIGELGRRGGDITQFGINGQPFEEGAQFDIRGPAPNVKPGSAQQPLTIDQLTPQQKAQLLQLLGGK